MPLYSANPLPGSPPIAATIEELGASVRQLYAGLEIRLLRLLDDRAAKGLATDDLAERAAIAYEMQNTAQTMVENLATDAIAQQVIDLAAREGDAAALQRLGLAPNIPRSFSVFGQTQALAVASIASQLKGGLAGMAPHIIRSTRDTLAQVTGLVSSQVIGGAITRYQAQREAARMLVDLGVTIETGGRRWDIGSYAEMATRTATNRAWQEAHIQRMSDNGINLVTIIVGVGSCQKCARWAGKVLSTNGATGDIEQPHAFEQSTVVVHIDGTLEEARGAGWNHPNCRCSVAGYFPGMAPPMSATTYDEKAEKDRAQLRSLERLKREALKRQAVAPDDLARAEQKARVRAIDARIRQHVDATGINRQRYRERLSFSTGGPAIPDEPLPPRTPAPPKAPAPDPAKPTRAPAPGPKPKQSDYPGGMAGISQLKADFLEWDRRRIAYEADIIREGAAAPLEPAARRAALEAAKTGAEVGKVLGDQLAHRGIAVTGFTARQAVETTREYANAVVDMLEKYPEVVMHTVKISSLGPRTYAHVESHTSGYVEMVLNTRFATNRQGLLDAVASDVAAGFHPKGFVDARGVILHEFGHAIDAQREFLAGKTVKGTVDFFVESLGMKRISVEAQKWRRATLPGYAFDKRGALNGVEAIAEAFADVELNGDAALPIHQEMHHHLIATALRRNT